MTEPRIRHNIKVNPEAENDFKKIYEDSGDDEFFSGYKALKFQDEHKLLV